MTGSCGASQKKGQRKCAHLSSAGKKSSLTMMKRNRKWTSRAERTQQVVVEARQHQNGSERGSRFILGSQRSHCHNKTNSGFVDSSEGVGRKGRMSSTTDRYRAGILDGHRDRQIRSYGFQGTVTAGDESNQKGEKMGAGYVNLREKKEKAAEEGGTRRGMI